MAPYLNEEELLGSKIDFDGYWGRPTATIDWCEANYEVKVQPKIAKLSCLVISKHSFRQLKVANGKSVVQTFKQANIFFGFFLMIVLSGLVLRS